MKDMNPWVKVLCGAALVAIVIVVWVERSAAADRQLWSDLHVARTASVEELEDLRVTARGSDVEPWISLELALQLFENGDLESIARAGQVAAEALESHPDHPCATDLEEIRTAAESYRQ